VLETIGYIRNMHSIQKAMKALVVPMSLCVPSSGDYTDAGPVPDESEYARYHNIVFGQRLPIVVEGDISVKSSKFQGASAYQTHDLSSI
jgi:hypothetical protein